MIRRRYYRTFDYSVGRATVESLDEGLWSTTTRPPPSRVYDAGVHKLCTVKWNEPLLIGYLPTKTNRRGLTYHEIWHEIEMTFSGGIAEFAVIYKGKRVASHSVQVEYH